VKHNFGTKEEERKHEINVLLKEIMADTFQTLMEVQVMSSGNITNPDAANTKGIIHPGKTAGNQHKNLLMLATKSENETES
jgi:enhancing lycopene biosynthesis protein 2